MTNLVQRSFTDRVQEALSTAASLARHGGQPEVTPEHILQALAVVRHGVGVAILECFGIEIAHHTEELAASQGRCNPTGGVHHPEWSETTHALIAAAEAESRNFQVDYVGTEHLVLGMLGVPNCPAARFLRKHGASLERLRKTANSLLGPRDLHEPVS